MDIYLALKSLAKSDLYLKRYVKFVSAANRPKAEYTEAHHILPKAHFPQFKSLSKNPWNKVVLSFREHFVAHLLLAKALDTYEMHLAIMRMVESKHDVTAERIKSSRAYAKAKIRAKEAISNRLLENHPFRGKNHSLESRQKMSNSKAYMKKTYIYFHDLKRKVLLSEVDEYLAQGWLTYWTDEDRAARKRAANQKTVEWAAANIEEIRERITLINRRKDHKQAAALAKLIAIDPIVQAKKSKTMSTKIWVTDDTVNRRVFPDELSELLANGWRRGRAKLESKERGS